MEENCILLPYLGKKPQQQKIQIHIVDINFVECITSRVKLNILFIYLFFFLHLKWIYRILQERPRCTCMQNNLLWYIFIS